MPDAGASPMPSGGIVPPPSLAPPIRGLAHSPAGSRPLQLLPSDHRRASSFRLQHSARRGTEPPPPDPHQCTRFGAAAGTSGCLSEEKRQGQLLCPQTNSFPLWDSELGLSRRESLVPPPCSGLRPSSFFRSLGMKLSHPTLSGTQIQATHRAHPGASWSPAVGGHVSASIGWALMLFFWPISLW